MAASHRFTHEWAFGGEKRQQVRLWCCTRVLAPARLTELFRPVHPLQLVPSHRGDVAGGAGSTAGPWVTAPCCCGDLPVLLLALLPPALFPTDYMQVVSFDVNEEQSPTFDQSSAHPQLAGEGGSGWFRGAQCRSGDTQCLQWQTAPTSHASGLSLAHGPSR